MISNVELYINGNKCDILDLETFAQQLSLTYSFSDLYSPDKIVDTYSKTIDLPGTSVNNQIFGHIWRIDSSTIATFNPSQLTDFYILINGTLFQKGTLQLAKIVMEQGRILKYQVNLYGSLTNIFSKLMNGDINDPNNKLLRSLKYPNRLTHPLTKHMLYRMWKYRRYEDPGYNLCEYMNYVPCLNGVHENFDSSKKLQVYDEFTDSGADGNMRKSEEGTASPYIACKPYIFDDYRDMGGQVYEASSEDTNFDEYTTGEYRVEYQRPALKVKKLLEQIVIDSSRDASINLDTNFFYDGNGTASRTGNPYFNNSYLVLPQYSTDDEFNTATGTFGNMSYTLSIRSGASNVYSVHANVWNNLTQDTGDLNVYIEGQGANDNYIDIANNHGTSELSFEFMIRTTVRFPYDPNDQSGYDVSSGDIIAQGTWNGNVGDYWRASDAKFLPGSWDVSVHLQTWDAGQAGATLGYSQPFTTGFDSSLSHPLNSGMYGSYKIEGYSWYRHEIPYVYTGTDGSDSVFTYSNTDLKETIGDTYKPVNDSSYYWKPFKQTIITSGLSWKCMASIYIRGDRRYVVARKEGGSWKVHKTGERLPTYFEIVPIAKIPSGADSSTYNTYIPYDYGWEGIDSKFTLNKAFRSGDSSHGVVGSTVDIADMVDETTTQGEFLLNYSKLFGLLWDVDKFGNITIMDRNTYFDDYKILDWTDKVDYSKPIEINPVTFDSKYYELKYQNGDTYYEKKYAKNQGVDYGAKIINTGYAFNSDTTELLEDTIFNNTILAEEPRYQYSGTVALRYNKPVISFGKEQVRAFSLPAYYEGDKNEKNPSDTKFNLLFKDTGDSTSSGVSKRIFISEDSSIMLNEDASVNGGQYCWIDYNSSSNSYIAGLIQNMGAVPRYTTHNGSCSWDFAGPKVNYENVESSDYPSSGTIYERFWKDYLAEIYNVRNKVVTYYMNLTPIDMAQFSFKNFVTIDGVLFHPIKIEDYKPLGKDTTKVTLLKVTSLGAYIAGQNIPYTT